MAGGCGQRVSLCGDILGQLPGLLRLVFVPAAGLVQRLRPVAHDADVGAEVVLLGRGGEGERMPLKSGNRRALDEDVLAHLHVETFPSHPQLQRFGRVHHHLADRGRCQRLDKQRQRRVFLANTHLGDHHLLVGSIETNDPFAHVEDHGAHHPLPRLERRKLWDDADQPSADWMKWRLTIGGFPANSGTAQWDPCLPHSSNRLAHTSGSFVFWLAGVWPRTIRLRRTRVSVSALAPRGALVSDVSPLTRNRGAPVQ